MAKALLKQLVSLILPVTALVVVPLCIEPDVSRGRPVALALGLAILLIGLLVMAWTISLFIRIGRGTLAPWSPTARLVVGGPYAHVRNPMILGVLIVLLGEALAAESWRILAWAMVFFSINAVYFVFLEEPGLEGRFGEQYRVYKRHVPRWIPRLKAWHENRDEGA